MILQIKQIISALFKSNTYILSTINSCDVWLVDVGNIEDVIKELPDKASIAGVFLTHTHLDHIFGINKLVDLFPDCTVFTSEFGKESLYSSKLNLSYYHDYPIVFKGSKIHVLKETINIKIFNNYFIEVIETPGHNPGCLTYVIGDNIFTGDSYIPGYKVVTKLKGGDKNQSELSLLKIGERIKESTTIYPGHGDNIKGCEFSLV
jgi:hydroxyacylglutathione hydrolase